MAGVDTQERVMEEASSPSTKADTRNRSKSASKKRTPVKAVTVPQPFNLGLTKRVEERQQYRAELAKKQKAAEERERVRREEAEEEERRDLKEYRKTLDFKATPVQKYPLVTINPSSKELTCPTAPNLSTSLRRRIGSEGDSSMDENTSQQSSNSPLPISEAAPA